MSLGFNEINVLGITILPVVGLHWWPVSFMLFQSIDGGNCNSENTYGKAVIQGQAHAVLQYPHHNPAGGCFCNQLGIQDVLPGKTCWLEPSWVGTNSLDFFWYSNHFPDSASRLVVPCSCPAVCFIDLDRSFYSRTFLSAYAALRSAGIRLWDQCQWDIRIYPVCRFFPFHCFFPLGLS